MQTGPTPVLSSSDPGGGDRDDADAPFGRRLAAVTGVILLLATVWMLTEVLLLVFSAVLVAVLLRAAADPLKAHLPVGDKVAVILAMAIVAGVLGGFFVLVGRQVASEASDLIARLPEIITALEQRFNINNLGERIVEQAANFASRGGVVQATAGYSILVVSGVASALLVIAGGVYFALDPGLYRRGILALLPRPIRSEGRATLDGVGTSLRLWLLGQLVAMILVGCLTTAGLWLLGIESALALGVFSGLMDFIPVVGPIIGAVPAIAVAATEGTTTALWVTALYLVVQQIEGNLISPLIHQKTLSLPPALTLFAIVAFGILFGPMGVVLAAPLTAAAAVVVERLWVREVVGET